MTTTQYYPWRHGVAMAIVCGSIGLSGCAAHLESLVRRSPEAGEKNSPAEETAAKPNASSNLVAANAPPTAPESSRRSPPVERTTQSAPAVGEANRSPPALPVSQTSPTSPALSTSSASPALSASPANWSEIEQVLAAAGSSLTPEQQQFLRTQMMAILADKSAGHLAAAQASQAERTNPNQHNHLSAEMAAVLPGPHQDPSRFESVHRPVSHQAPVPISLPIPAGSSVASYTEPPATASVQTSSTTRLKQAESGPQASASTQPAQHASAPETTPTSQQPAAVEKIEDIRSGQWRSSLARTLDELEKELARFPHDDRETASLTTTLRILHAIANHPDEATKAIDKLPDEEQEFWTHQMHALLLALDAENKHVASRRAALVLRELRSAVDCLANVSTLDVRNMAFCEAVESYGRYTEFRTQSFRPGAEVLLYVEIENFTAEPVGDKFETELQATYDVFDSDGIRIANVALPLDKQLCDNRRRDYFVAYHLFLPTNVRSGSYTLRLTIEDLKGHKSSQGSIDFRIR